MSVEGPDITKSALIVVDMQNDFVSKGGYFDRISKAHPENAIDHDFLAAQIPNVARLIGAFRSAGRPVVYVRHALQPDYSDACFPYWRLPKDPGPIESGFIVEGTWGSAIVDELKPRVEENVVVKKGYNGFHNTPLEPILRNLGVTTCVMSGVTSCVCVSSTTRAGVERNFRMLFVSDCTAETHRESHECELGTVSWAYADVVTADEVIAMLRAC